MLQTLYQEMKELTLKAGIKENRYDNVFLKARDSEDIIRQLESIKELEYKGLLDIYGMLPKETWERYEQLNYEGLREQELLKDRFRSLRKAWSSIKTNISRNSNDKPEAIEESSPGQCVQSPRTGSNESGSVS